MHRARAIVVSLALAAAAVAAVLALTNTFSLAGQARASSDRQVTERTAQLDRYEASLRQALAQKPKALPPLPRSASSTAPATAAVPVRVVYERATGDVQRSANDDEDAKEHDHEYEHHDEHEHDGSSGSDNRHGHEKVELDD